MQLADRTIRAPEIYGDFWFNSGPLTLQALLGQVVLVDFWDYTCVNCHRTLPYIKEWHKRYQDKGLVIIGVHTPEFPFGKNPEYVQRAIKELQISYPIVMDNDYLIWDAFANRSWPAEYLIDKDGYIRYYHFGEGGYGHTEQAIQILLTDAGYGDDLPPIMDVIREMDKPGALCYRVTPEIYTGYLRGTLGNLEGYNPESVLRYQDPGIYVEGRFYAHGQWFSDRYKMRLEEEDGKEGYLIIRYRAAEVNAVIKPEGEKDFKVFITQDENYLSEENKGDDVMIDADGKSFLLIREPKMYNLVKNREFGDHILKLATTSNGFALYSFTFVSCLMPDLVM